MSSMVSKGTFTLTCDNCKSNDVGIYVDDISSGGYELHCNDCKAEWVQSDEYT